jgi:dihydroxyacetone kinase
MFTASITMHYVKICTVHTNRRNEDDELSGSNKLLHQMNVMNKGITIHSKIGGKSSTSMANPGLQITYFSTEPQLTHMMH